MSVMSLLPTFENRHTINQTMKPPVEVLSLFPLLDEKLLSLLRSFDREQWNAPTLAKQWRVKDVAAHLLDGNMRTITRAHQYAGDQPGAINSYQELVGYLNRLNADWVQAMKRVSPEQLIEMLESTGNKFCRIMADEQLFDEAPFSVAWAGEDISLNWFHIAREYTEKWHHQMQIRHAVGEEAELMTRELFYPCIDTLMYGLPYALRGIGATENSTIQVTVSTEEGGDWFVTYKDEIWTLSKEATGNIAAHVTIEPGMAWQLFTKGAAPEAAAESAIMKGDPALCRAVLQMVAVMA